MRSLLMVMTSTAKSRLNAASDSELSTPYAENASGARMDDTFTHNTQDARTAR